MNKLLKSFNYAYCLGLRDKYMYTALVWFEKNAYTFNRIIRARATTPLSPFKIHRYPRHKCTQIPLDIEANIYLSSTNLVL